jgi:hypothetical protein
MKRITVLGLCLCTLLVAFAVYAADKPVSVKGEVVDTFCYAAMGARGESHAKCGMKCAAKGIPVGLVEGNKMYILLPQKDAQGLPKEVTEHMGKVVTVTGNAYSAGGNNFLTVESVK